MTTKTKPNPRRTSLLLGLAAGLLVAVGLVALVLQRLGQPNLFSTGPADVITQLTPANVRETVDVPFDRAEPTLTAQPYSGRVRLVINGYGQAGGTQFSDAFYLFSDADGTLLNPPQPRRFDLEIDGQRAVDALALAAPPPFSRFHTYEAVYTVTDGPRAIAFRIADDNTADNTGAFQILVATP